jgi:DNA polymerase III subunit epsilon
MTRGQESLVIDTTDVQPATSSRSTPIDWAPTPAGAAGRAQEVAAHEALLADIHKASGGAAIWQPAYGIIQGSPEPNSGRLAQR